MGEEPAEPELQGSLPRRVKYTTDARLLRGFLWNLIPAILCLAYCFTTSKIAYFERLSVQGIRTNAEVTGTEIVPRKSVDHYYLNYQFATGVGSRSGSLEVDQMRYAEARVGDPIPLVYNSKDSTEYELGDVSTDSVDRARAGGIRLTVVILVAYLGGVLMYEAHLSGRRRLLQEGLATVATVTGRRVVEGKSRSYILDYTFVGWNGRGGAGSVTVDSDLYARCHEGAKFTVIVPSRSRDSSLPYFKFWEAEIKDERCKAIMPYRA